LFILIWLKEKIMNNNAMKEVEILLGADKLIEPCSPRSYLRKVAMTTPEYFTPENPQGGGVPYCKVHRIGSLVGCGENPFFCKWYLTFGNEYFCRHPSAKLWASEL
jgi:hypothetical protein